MTTATRPTTDPTESTHGLPASDRGTWELDRARCAVGIELALPGATIWRARLRPRTAHLTQSDRGSHGTGDGIGLTASLMAGPPLASLPFTRALFLRGTPRTASITVEADGELGGADPDNGGAGGADPNGLLGEAG